MMARKVKCKICGNELDLNLAYCIKKISEKTGKTRNEYYCSEEEYKNNEREKQLYKEIQYFTDNILGHPITNNNRNKKIKELQDAGYTNEQIFRCFKYYKDDIIYYMDLKEDMKENQKILYMFAVIGNNIADFVKEDKKKNDWKQYEKEEINEDEIDIIEEDEDEIIKRLKNKKNNESALSSFFKGLK